MIVIADNFYERLGVSEDATKKEIQAKWKKLIKELHPDAVHKLMPGADQAKIDEAIKYATEMAQAVNEAYSVLSDSKKRAEYDKQLKKERAEASKAAYRNKSAQSADKGKATVRRDWTDKKVWRSVGDDVILDNIQWEDPKNLSELQEFLKKEGVHYEEVTVTHSNKTQTRAIGVLGGNKTALFKALEKEAQKRAGGHEKEAPKTKVNKSSRAGKTTKDTHWSDRDSWREVQGKPIFDHIKEKDKATVKELTEFLDAYKIPYDEVGVRHSNGEASSALRINGEHDLFYMLLDKVADERAAERGEFTKRDWSDLKQWRTFNGKLHFDNVGREDPKNKQELEEYLGKCGVSYEKVTIKHSNGKHSAAIRISFRDTGKFRMIMDNLNQDRVVERGEFKNRNWTDKKMWRNDVSQTHRGSFVFDDIKRENPKNVKELKKFLERNNFDYEETHIIHSDDTMTRCIKVISDSKLFLAALDKEAKNRRNRPLKDRGGMEM